VRLDDNKLVKSFELQEKNGSGTSLRLVLEVSPQEDRKVVILRSELRFANRTDRDIKVTFLTDERLSFLLSPGGSLWLPCHLVSANFELSFGDGDPGEVRARIIEMLKIRKLKHLSCFQVSHRF